MAAIALAKSDRIPPRTAKAGVTGTTGTYSGGRSGGAANAIRLEGMRSREGSGRGGDEIKPGGRKDGREELVKSRYGAPQRARQEGCGPPVQLIL
jgi:hypothetical protein